MVQLLDVIDPEVLFRQYVYVTGTSDTVASHNEEYAQTVVDFLELGPDDLVLEIASNDGSLLKFFKRRRVKTLGVEPATNIAAIAQASGIDTLNEFFNSDTAAQIKTKYGPAQAVLGNNVLAHVDNTKDFLHGCKDILAKKGMAVFEVPYLRELLLRLEYDTIYHEHLCYFSVTSLVRLCDEVGLSVVRIDHMPIHGGSLRIYAGHKEGRNDQPGPL
jgi:cyclopropane fatty-acyl-phospholipid synthase-like methyltransferase